MIHPVPDRAFFHKLADAADKETKTGGHILAPDDPRLHEHKR
jgi:hypothetical protein